MGGDGPGGLCFEPVYGYADFAAVFYLSAAGYFESAFRQIHGPQRRLDPKHHFVNLEMNMKTKRYCLQGRFSGNNKKFLMCF